MKTMPLRMTSCRCQTLRKQKKKTMRKTAWTKGVHPIRSRKLQMVWDRNLNLKWTQRQRQWPRMARPRPACRWTRVAQSMSR